MEKVKGNLRKGSISDRCVEALGGLISSGCLKKNRTLGRVGEPSNRRSSAQESNGSRFEPFKSAVFWF